MQKARFYHAMGLWLGLIWLMSFHATVVEAQDATEPSITPQIADTCADVRFLMARDTTPDQLLQGGGILQANTLTNGQVGAGTDMGDHWLFAVDGATNSSTVTISFSNLPADVPLEFALFKGMTRVTTGNTYQPIVAGETYTLPTKVSGVYTLVVQLANINDLERLSQTVSYSITANYQSAVDTLAAVNAQRVRDGQTNQDLIQGQDYEVKDGKQIFTFRSGSLFKIDATGLKSITQMPDKAGRVDFDGGGTLIVDSWAQEISLLGGNLSVIGQVNKVQRVYYIENFGAGASIINPTQTNLRDITDSNQTHIATDWTNVTGVWVMTDCMGYKLSDGRIFTVVIDNQITTRDFQIYGAPDATVVNCGAFLMRLSALNAVGKTVDENLCFSWTPIEAGTEVTLRGGILSASLLNGRSIRLQSDSIRMLPLQGVVNADAPDLPMDIQVNDGDQPVSIKLDWTNLASFAYADEGANGRTLSFTFIDEPRTSTTRSGVNVQSIDALDDVLHIVYRGDNGSATNGRELLLLPRSESYLEVVTPAGVPTFNGAVFNGQALPDEAGYQARGLNNLGGECYPVNTLLDNVNCAPNGDINPANSNLWYSVTDLVAYHPLFNLSLTRNYNSYNFAQDGAFGAGWTSDFPLDYTVAFDQTSNSRLLDLSNADPATRIKYRTGLDVTWAARGIVVYTTASGSQHEFVRDDKASGTAGEVYRALTMPAWSLSRSGADAVARVRSNWTLSQTAGLTYNFDRAGRLHSFGYPSQGYEAVIHYPYEDNLSGPGALGDQPVTITDSTGTRQLELFYDKSHHIVRSRLRDLLKADVEGGSCNLEESCFEVNYGYSNGRLTDVTYAGGQKASYAYDDLGRLIRHDDPRAPIATIMGYTYDDTGAIGQAAVNAAYILNADEAAPKEDSFVWRRLETVIDGGKRQVTITDENRVSSRRVYSLASGTLTSAGDSYTLLESDHLWASAGSFEAVPTKYEWAEGQLQAIPNRFLQGAATSGRSRVEFGYDANGQIASLSGGYPGLNITATASSAVQFPVRQIVPQQLNSADGASWSFGGYNEAGFFSNYSDANGAKYTIERDANNRPIRVLRNDDKVTWNLKYDDASGLLSSVQQVNLPKNDNGYTVKYEWDGLGRLIVVTDDLLGTYNIAYSAIAADANGQFYSSITVTDPSGAVTLSRFDGRGRLVETRLQTSADAKDFLSRTTYEYDPADKVGRVSASVRWLAGTGDPIASRTSYQYAAQPQLDQIGETVAIGGTKVTQTDPYGRQTIAVYDALGRIRLLGDAGNILRRFDYTVDGVRNPLPANQINPNGLKIVEQDYLAGQLTASTDYLFDYGWQLTGVIRTEQNPFASPSGSWTSEWRLFSQTVNNINPNLRSLIAPVEDFPDPGIVWGGSYINGRATQVTAQRTNPLTGKPDIDPNAQTRFDFLGRPLELTQTVNGATQTTSITYCTLANGGSFELRSKPGAPALNCDKSADAALALSYDAQQRLVASSDPSGNRSITYTVDATTGGSTVEVKSASATGGAIYTWALAYDAAGRLTAWTDEQGVAHSYTYDTLGRLIAVKVADQPQASYTFTYNLADLLTTRVDGTGRGFAYNYDASGHLILQQNVLTKDSVSYTYDTRGQLISQISPLGSVTTYEYNDPVDPTRLTAVITAAGREQFTWDDSKSTVTYSDPRGNQTVYTFDGLGELWKVAAPLGRTYQLTYDEAGGLTGWQVQEGSSSRSIKLSNDFAKNQIAVSADGVDWNWAFDLNSAGQLAGVTNPAGQKLGLSYDPLGKLTGLTAGSKLQWKLERTAGSSDLTITGQNGETTYSFDALYRLVKVQQGEAATGYEYATSGDPNGLVNVRLTDVDGTQVYTFWPGDERQPPQIIVRTAGQRLIYTYNTENLLESISREVCLVGPFSDLKGAALDQIDQFSPTACQDETSTDVWLGSSRFLYDSLGQPIRTIDAEQNSESFTYDAVGNLVSYQNPDGKTYTYEYDAENRVNRISSPAGIDLLFSYALDGIANICQSRSLDRADYAGCVAKNGIIQSYSYDSLGRRLSDSFPLVQGTGQVASSYDAVGGGAPTTIGGVALTYSADALGTLKRVGEQDVNSSGWNTLTGISGDAGFEMSYDAQGRLQAVKAQGSNLSISYADDGAGYSITEDKSGSTLQFKAGGNGLIESIDYKPGNPDEATPVLQIQFIGQEANGLTSFSLLWGDNYITDFRANRRGENIYVNHQTQDFDLGLTLDTVHSSSGLLQRQVITGGSASTGYFSSKVTGGYITVLGYDQNDRLLTMRLSESQGNRLIYQATYVYSDYGQLLQETRQYEGGTQAVISYRYDVKARNLLVGRDVSISQANPTAQSAVGIVALILLGSGGAFGLRRYGSRRMLSGMLAAALLLGLVGFMPSNRTLAQDAPTPVTQARFSYAYDEHGNLTSITPEGGKECVTYTYDAANHLTSVTNADKSSVAYKYDAYGRLVAAGKTSLIYVGNSQTPLLVVENGTPRFYAHTADGDTLFQATADGITPFINTGDGQVLGHRTYGTAETSADVYPVWLFDPFGRYLTLSAPAAVTDPCTILSEKPDAAIPNFLPAFNGMLWDTQTNLYFNQGRAYSPALARFLQRDSRGPDAQGNVYDFAASRSTPPIRKADVPYLDGLLKLTSASAIDSQLGQLSAASVASQYAPSPLGALKDTFAAQLRQPRQDQQSALDGLLNLPAWLAKNYNLPTPRFDPSTGALRLLQDNAPGQGGWQDGASVDFQSGVWGGSVSSSVPLAPQQQLAKLMARDTTRPAALHHLSQSGVASTGSHAVR
jgi:RHS repeat-associated protein